MARRVVNFASLIRALGALVGGAVYILIGLAWSRESFFVRSGFDLGWVLVAVLVSRCITAFYLTTTRGPLGRELWHACSPGIPGFGLEFLADWALHTLRTKPSETALIIFALLSSGFLVFVAFVIAAFDWNASRNFSPKKHIMWRRIGYITAVGVSVTVVAGAGSLILWQRGAVSPQLLTALESWLYRCSLLIYIFLTLSMFFPFIEASILRAYDR